MTEANSSSRPAGEPCAKPTSGWCVLQGVSKIAGVGVLSAEIRRDQKGFGRMQAVSLLAEAENDIGSI